MSQTAADGDDAELDGEAEDPEIEEDLFEEELRIDGICGVY
jgi:mycofactocin precursor